MSRAEMDARGWAELDVLLVSGDAYVDHPAFGVALLGRWLEAHGCRVGIVAQPRWDNIDDIVRLGRPRLFAGVAAGALDSMLAHYTAFRKLRHDDAYTPGGRHGARPNRACLVYTGLVRQAFPGLPVVLGGIEASLRRATHFDFWSNAVRRSILLDSKADLLVYGMGERQILEAAERLKAGGDLRGIAGTAFAAGCRDESWRVRAGGAVLTPLPSHEDILAEPRHLMAATLAMEAQVHEGQAWAVQRSKDRDVVFTPPAPALDTEELDRGYGLPFTRRPHPSYVEPIPAVEMIQFSVTTHRGCGGGCSFCSLALHQGRRIASRSAGSIAEEVLRLTAHPAWTGSLSDVGGPSANMWGAHCASPACTRSSCMVPKICPHFQADQAALLELLRRLRALPGVKHVRVASGIRHDLALSDEGYTRALAAEFTGGQLKLAPEHCCARVLQLMRKPPFETFEAFLTVFERESQQRGKEQYVIPYLISAFPGCTDEDMRALAAWLTRRGWRPQQVQCFIPTPGTVATAMFYAGIDSEGAPIAVARSDADRLRQHGILMPDRKPNTKKRQGG